MRIEPRNVKYAAFASEETSCFEAAIYIDGKREGTARNDGKGGMTFIQPNALEQRLAAHAATLPARTYGDMTLAVTADGLIDDLLAEHLIAQDLKRLLRTRIVTVNGGKCYQRTAMPAKVLAEAVTAMRQQDSAAVLKRLDADWILNLCTFDEALRLYREHAA